MIHFLIPDCPLLADGVYLMNDSRWWLCHYSFHVSHMRSLPSHTVQFVGHPVSEAERKRCLESSSPACRDKAKSQN